MGFDGINELIFDKVYREEAHDRFGIKESSVWADMYVEVKMREMTDLGRSDR